MEEETQIQKLAKLFDALNLAIAGYLFKDGEIEEIPKLLKMMAEEYITQIKKEKLI